MTTSLDPESAGEGASGVRSMDVGAGSSGSDLSGAVGGGSEDSGRDAMLVLDAAGDHYLVRQGERLTVTQARGLLANDRSTTEQSLFASVITWETRRGGVVDLSADGSFTYTPPSETFWGTDAFFYRVEDEDGNTAESEVTVSVQPRTITLSSIPEAGAGLHFALEGRTMVAAAGDVNADGISDLLIGAPSASWNGAASGRVYVVYGVDASPASPVTLEPLDGSRGFAVDGEPSDYLGETLSALGDVDADGFDDVLVGTRYYDVGTNVNAGRCYVVFGSAVSPGNPITYATFSDGFSRGYTLEGTEDNGNFCTSARPGGDFNGDGIADLMVSAPQQAVVGENGERIPHVGQVYLFFGVDARPQPYASASASVADGRGVLFSGESMGLFAGRSVDGIGDFNGDGLDDLAITATLPIAGSEYTTQGARVYLVFGTRDPANEVALTDVAAGVGGVAWDGPNDGTSSSLPLVAGIGDFNGDGLADVVVGDIRAPFASAEGDAGRVSVLFGRRSPASRGSLVELSDSDGFIIHGTSWENSVGGIVAGVGDFNGDGLDDFVTAGYDYTSAYLVLGTRAEIPSLLAIDEVLDSGIGIGVDLEHRLYSAGGVGDLNGDGLADVVFGTEDGAYVLFGHTFTERSVRRGKRMTGVDVDETFIGTAESDVVASSRGLDVVYAGRGDDEIVLEEGTFFRIDGGVGMDLVRLTGEGTSLDLTALPRTSFRSIEVIDITGSGNNTLRIDSRSLLGLSNDVMQIRGNEGDEVELDLRHAGFSELAPDSENVVYGNGVLSIRLSAEMSIRTTL